MGSSHRRLAQAACLVLLLGLQAAQTQAHGSPDEKYCDGEFHLALLRTCAVHKRNRFPGLGFGDVFPTNRFGGNIKRSIDGTAEEGVFRMSGLQKRAETMAYHCCHHGCTTNELAAVC